MRALFRLGNVARRVSTRLTPRHCRFRRCLFVWHSALAPCQLLLSPNAGEKADSILPSNAKVIAPYNGDTTFLYYINRPGWPAFESSVENLKKLGATHMVLVSPTAADKNGFGKQFQIVAENKDYLILKL